MLKTIMTVAVAVLSLLLACLILMHKGKGGGMSDMFGGGVASSVGSSGVAEKNLNRLTVSFVIVWVLTIVLLGLLAKVG